MGERKARRFKNYIVDNELQMQVLAYGTLYMLLVILVTLAIMIFPLTRQMELPGSMDVSYYAAQAFILMITKIIPAIAVIYLLYLIHMTIITHRICGPLVNFRNVFKSLEQGDLQRRVYLRRGDYLTKEMVQINSMIDELARVIGHASAEHHMYQEQLDNVLKLRKEDPSRDITPDLEKLRETAASTGDALSFFQLGKP
jgi:hypothetical protein